MNLMNDEAHWLAGLLEGEGSFLAAPPSAPNRPCISIEMTDLDVIVHAASVMGITYIHQGRRHPERGWKQSYRIALRAHAVSN